MAPVVIIDTRWNTPYAKQKWLNYADTLDVVMQKMQQLSPVCLVVGPQGDIAATAQTPCKELYELIKNKTQADDTLVYVYADEPFIDVALSQTMLGNHQKYFADFSFAEGYPQGLAPFIISAKILPDLIELATEQDTVLNSLIHTRNFFFQTIKQDINRFSIETEISPVDVRALRLQLNYENKNNSLICQKIMQAGATDACSILKVVQEQPALLWGCPTYYNIQVSGNCPQACSYCPYQTSTLQGQFMTAAQLQTVLQQAQELSHQAVISLSYMGEAVLHPDFASLMQTVLSFEGFSLHIETSGLGWTEKAWQTLLQLDRTRVSLIVSLDAHEQTLYEKMRGSGFEEAMAFTDKCLANFKENTWVQCVRCKTTEPHLESFYRCFQQKGAQVIIQKYDDFCQSLPQDQPVCIAPLQRHVCWALQREISILVDGSVPLCRCGLNTQSRLGNVLQGDSLAGIWDKMEYYRQEQAKQIYQNTCEHCDEYYIFNF